MYLFTENTKERLERIRREVEQEELEENETVRKDLERKGVLPQGYLIRTEWGERYFA